MTLPGSYEEQAWVGVRWVVRKHTYAHVVAIENGYPPAYAKAAGTGGPAVVVTFRAPAAELDAFAHTGHPFFRPPWAPNVVGMFLGDSTDWTEVAELLTESYRLLAPKRPDRRA